MLLKYTSRFEWASKRQLCLTAPDSESVIKERQVQQGMQAIILTGGKQYNVSEGDTLFIEKLDAQAGDDVVFDRVLAIVDGENTKFGTPVVEGAKVVSPTGNIAKFAKYSSLPNLSQIWMYMPVTVAGVGMIIFELEQLFLHIEEFCDPSDKEASAQ